MDIAINFNAPIGVKIVPVSDPEAKHSILQILLIAFACILIAGCIGLCGYCIFKRHKERKLATILYAKDRALEG